MTKPLTYATVCSGVEAVSLAWKGLGFKPVFFADNAAFPQRFLAERFPEVPNLGDMLKIDGAHYNGKVDILWGSTPCQSFSLAGLRKGIEDPRGALTPALVGLADAINPRFLCWENVDAVLTDKENAFGLFLAALSGSDQVLVPPRGRWTDAGHVVGPTRAIAWRVLDAQHFWLPQQRRRVFLVACPRDGADPREILFEEIASDRIVEERLCRYTYPVAGAPGCTSAYGVAIRGRKHGQQIEERNDISNCLRASQGGSDKPMALVYADSEWRVRNLTPREAERLMGMTDDWTLITGASDSERYHAIGNSLAVPVVKWIGGRIAGLVQGQ